jgi:hypothetical protein
MITKKTLLVSGNRTEIRKQIASEFLQEEPGTGEGDNASGSHPSHKDVTDDLKKKKEENPLEFESVMLLIQRLYACEQVSDEEMRRLKFTIGHPIELILKVIKWMFIEQDVTYWNWSGREMLFTRIQQI